MSPIRNENTAQRDAQLITALFSLTVSLTFAAVYLLSRVGLKTSLWPAAQIVSISALVLLAPYGYRTVSRYRGWTHADSWLNSDSFLYIAAVTALVGAGHLTGWLGVSLYPIFGVIGGLLGLHFGAELLRGKLIRRHGRRIIGAVALGAFFASVAWGTAPHGGEYLHPLSEERLILGDANQDNLSNIAIGNMIATYRYPSTGLDGLVYMHYHYASHWIMGEIAVLLGLPLFHVYHIGLPVIFLPLFFASVLTLATQFGHWFPAPDKPRRSEDRWFWLAFALMSLSVFPYDTQFGIGIVWEKFLLSESFSISFTQTLLLFGVALAVAERIDRKTLRPAPREAAFIACVLPALLFVLGFTKISSFALVMSVYGYLFLRLRLFRRPIYLFSFGLSLILAVNIYHATNFSAEETSSIFPFAYILRHVGIPNVALWLLIDLFWVWLYLLARFIISTDKTLNDLRRSAAQNRWLDVEILLLYALAGIMPGLVFDVAFFNAGFFFDMQYWLAGAMLLGYLPHLIEKTHPFAGIKRRRLAQMTLSQGMLGAVLGLMVMSAAGNYLRLFPTLITANLRVRAAFVDPERTWFTVLAENGLSRLIHIQADVTAHPRYDLVMALNTLNDTPPDDKRRSLVYVPKTERLYWDWFAERCSAAPFVVPAMTGMALVEGLPALSCSWRDYGYEDYDVSVDPASILSLATLELCARVRELGFERVAILEGDPVRVTWQDCASSP